MKAALTTSGTELTTAVISGTCPFYYNTALAALSVLKCALSAASTIAYNAFKKSSLDFYISVAA